MLHRRAEVTLQGVNRCGGAYLHALLLHPARGLLMHTNDPTSWVEVEQLSNANRPIW